MTEGKQIPPVAGTADLLEAVTLAQSQRQCLAPNRFFETATAGDWSPAELDHLEACERCSEFERQVTVAVLGHMAAIGPTRQKNPSVRARALVLTGPHQVAWTDRLMAPVGPSEALVQSVLSSIKHGTEMMGYKGAGPFSHQRFDDKLRAFVPDDSPKYPRPVGNVTVGRILEVGCAVTRVRPGDLVYSWTPIQTHGVVAAEQLSPLAGLTPDQAVCLDPAFFALAAVRDGLIGVGDRVLVTGLGAIGLYTVRLAKKSGATVYAISSLPNRVELARHFGADVVLDRRETPDPALRVKELTEGGVDVAIECSGDTRTLNEALRAVRQCGRVVTVGFYPGEGQGLRLGEAFFHNRITLLSSLPAPRWQNPDRAHPLWSRERLNQQVIALFEDGTLTANGLLSPVLPFDRAAEAFRLIDEHPEQVIKIGITYPG